MLPCDFCTSVDLLRFSQLIRPFLGLYVELRGGMMVHVHRGDIATKCHKQHLQIDFPANTCFPANMFSSQYMYIYIQQVVTKSLLFRLSTTIHNYPRLSTTIHNYPRLSMMVNAFAISGLKLVTGCLAAKIARELSFFAPQKWKRR